jgi:hypothetical protein
MQVLKNKSYLRFLLTEKFLESFWFEVEQKFLEKKKITERDCQRIFVFCMRCFHPEIFTKMISDTPGMSNSVGYDIILISESKTIFIDLKTKKGKKENSQITLQKEVEVFEFIEYFFLVVDLERKILYTI